jgi:hypothetical protein
MPAVKNVGEPCAGEPHARFDGGREETGTSRHLGRKEPGASRLPDHPPGPRGGCQSGSRAVTDAGRRGFGFAWRAEHVGRSWAELSPLFGFDGLGAGAAGVEPLAPWLCKSCWVAM